MRLWEESLKFLRGSTLIVYSNPSKVSHPTGAMLAPVVNMGTVIILMAYSPAILFLYCILSMLLLSYSSSRYNQDTNIAKSFFVVLAIGISYATIIAAVSEPIFLYEESDFTTYYNNYLLFLHNDFSSDFFEFGAGLEVGVPLLNYFLSIIIGGEYPNIVRLFYSVLMVLLFNILIFSFNKKKKLTVKELSLLYVMSFIFFKYGALLNHLRQGIASFFICYAVFSEGKKKWLPFLVAISFHASSLAIYPLVNFLLRSKDRRKLSIFILVSLVSAALLFLFVKILSQFMASSNILVLAKLVWAFSKVTELDNVLASLKLAFTASVYIVPILMIYIIKRIKYGKPSKNDDWLYNILSIYIYTLAFSFLPGISIRTLTPIYSILMGYLYFVSFTKITRFTQVREFSLIIIIFFFMNWIFSSPKYYYQYPMFDSSPFYYADQLFKTSGHVYRETLPSLEDKEIINPNR
ncbi:EpsG family protein [Gallaecimonas xiamenensis]|uniref:Uncharacterized protein n=1 Tax=Gallaecimonas xiamenensis 3-C-1 TaxID=745411 RepID=K2JYG2_9GAMM|nr:EpsG family protein [Gallaecimonas xiamenensis]EKE75364.1 hypothetical protein B3C1_06799 [Gallaecimonas xiamenensis 3-C-1]